MPRLETKTCTVCGRIHRSIHRDTCAICHRQTATRKRPSTTDNISLSHRNVEQTKPAPQLTKSEVLQHMKSLIGTMMSFDPPSPVRIFTREEIAQYTRSHHV